MLAKRKGGLREEASEGSVEQNHDPTNRNRIRGRAVWTSERWIAKSIIHQAADPVDPAGVWRRRSNLPREICGVSRPRD